MAESGKRTGSDGRSVSPTTARVVGYNSPDAMIKSPTYAKDAKRAEQIAANEKKRVFASTGKVISGNKALKNVYNRM